MFIKVDLEQVIGLLVWQVISISIDINIVFVIRLVHTFVNMPNVPFDNVHVDFLLVLAFISRFDLIHQFGVVLHLVLNRATKLVGTISLLIVMRFVGLS